MRDEMMDMVCSDCGCGDVWMEEGGPAWYPDDIWWCPECCDHVDVETRAEYIAAVTADKEDGDA